ncbi:MAG TPA: hypothetical protein PK821_03890, partial [Victivallales bacterium]|nr:hypothetical protein [Victivallales bacterium]
GIYIYMDTLTYRKFRNGDGVVSAEKLPNAARPYSNFDPYLIGLQKEFNEQLWTHKNPYTGLMYKDDPAIVMTEIANENQVFEYMKKLEEPYKNQLEDRYRKWLKGKDIDNCDHPINLNSEEKNVIEFLVQVQTEYFKEIYDHLRSIGVKIPIAGTNWQKGGMATLASHAQMDFADSHSYWYDFTWDVANRKFRNDSMTGDMGNFYMKLSCMRLSDKPFFVSEWDGPWPNEWRAEITLNLAAVSSLQGWSGTAIHTYSYDCRHNVDQIAQPITSDALAGVAYRSGVFSTFNDPAKFGLFYHASLMFRRGDVWEHDTMTEIVLDDITHVPDNSENRSIMKVRDIRAALGASEVCKIGMRLPNTKKNPGTHEIGVNSTIVNPESAELRSKTGELYRNIEKKYGIIDTPRTKSAYGFIGTAGILKMKGMLVKSHTDFATIAISSLSDSDISDSDNMLLTAIGRADNTAAEYNIDHTVQFKTGHGPVLAEVVEAEIEIETNISSLQVWSVNTMGGLIGRMPGTFKEGKFTFTIGKSFPSVYYIIQKF